MAVGQEPFGKHPTAPYELESVELTALLHEHPLAIRDVHLVVGEAGLRKGGTTYLVGDGSGVQIRDEGPSGPLAGAVYRHQTIDVLGRRDDTGCSGRLPHGLGQGQLDVELTAGYFVRRLLTSDVRSFAEQDVDRKGRLVEQSREEARLAAVATEVPRIEQAPPLGFDQQ